MSRNVDFSGVWIPIVTPFREGRIDHDALGALVKRLDDASAVTLPYPYWHQRGFGERNPAPV